MSSFDWDSSPIRVSTADEIASDSASVTSSGYELLMREDKRTKVRRSPALASPVAWRPCQRIPDVKAELKPLVEPSPLQRLARLLLSERHPLRPS